jgi:predicted outer membrane repeat protein
MSLVGLVIVAVFALALAGVNSVAAKTFTVNNNSDFGDFNPGDGVCNVNPVGTPVCTLRAAVEEANETIASDTIKFKCNAVKDPIVVGDKIDIEESVKIRGGSNKKCPVIEGGSNNGILGANDGVIKLQNLTFVDGNESSGDGDGGCVSSDVDIDVLDIKKVEFKNCEADGDGGAVEAQDDVVLITRSWFIGNESQDDGGALRVEDGSNTQVSKSTFKNNNADGDGGAIQVQDGDLTVSQSKFQNNNADEEGGAIKFASNDTAIIINNKFKNNTADEGGALCDDDNGSFTQFSNNFQGNQAFTDNTGQQDNICIPD